LLPHTRNKIECGTTFDIKVPLPTDCKLLVKLSILDAFILLRNLVFLW